MRFCAEGGSLRPLVEKVKDSDVRPLNTGSFMRTIGLIGGMSWQSSKLYYEQINQLVAHKLGGASSAKLILYSIDFAPLAQMQTDGRWDGSM